MLRTILVPLDGSQFAEAALPLAKTLATLAGARLTLLSLHDARPDLPHGLDVPATEGETLALRSAAHDYLAETAQRLTLSSSLEIHTEVADADPAHGLVEAADRIAPDLVIMATHGRGPMSRFWLGSVTDYFIRHGLTPTLLVRPGRLDPPSTIRRILVALDLSEESAKIFDPVALVARAFSAEVVLYHVVEPLVGMVDGALPFPIPVVPGALDRAKTEANLRMEELARTAAGRGLTPTVKVVTGVGAAASLLEEARQGYDLVALTTHGAGGVRRLILGSVADKVIRGGDLPVLVYRGDGRPA